VKTPGSCVRTVLSPHSNIVSVTNHTDLDAWGPVS
jgi:hypothetical protein